MPSPPPKKKNKNKNKNNTSKKVKKKKKRKKKRKNKNKTKQNKTKTKTEQIPLRQNSSEIQQIYHKRGTIVSINQYLHDRTLSWLVTDTSKNRWWD